MKKVKPWHWVLIALGFIGFIVGIGFIPIGQIPHTYDYECNPYPCTKTEPYTYTVNVPYTVTQELTYTTWGSSAWESWDLALGCKVSEEIKLRNTDTVGGYFTVRFYCYYGDRWRYSDKTEYIGLWEHATFGADFDIGCDEPWSWKEPVVVPPTKSYTEYRQEQRTGYREVEATCYDTCYSTWYETERLFWR